MTTPKATNGATITWGRIKNRSNTYKPDGAVARFRLARVTKNSPVKPNASNTNQKYHRRRPHDAMRPNKPNNPMSAPNDVPSATSRRIFEPPRYSGIGTRF